MSADSCGMCKNAISASERFNKERNMDTACNERAAFCKASQSIHAATEVSSDERWVDDLVAVYSQLGGKAAHSAVYRKMKETRLAAGRSWPDHGEEAIRQTLQAHCAESPQYRGGADLFRMVRRGLWELKDIPTE
jgi:hypothetical protein